MRRPKAAVRAVYPKAYCKRKQTGWWVYICGRAAGQGPTAFSAWHDAAKEVEHSQAKGLVYNTSSTPSQMPSNGRADGV